MQISRKCSGCEQSFRKTELVEYFSASGKTSSWYCPQCLKERQSRDKFSAKVCEIFRLKSPGPVIWKQRKKLMDTYGYTDDTIINCLEYIYNVKHFSKLSETLVLIKPALVEEMKAWKRQQDNKTGSLAAAILNTNIKEYIVQVDEEENKKEEINLDDGLFDD